MEVKADQRFYTNNWQEFVHLQYLTELLKLVPDFNLPDGETIDTVNNFVVTVNKYGETPIVILYRDKLGGEHTLHVTPEITDRVNEIIRENIKAVDNGKEVNWDKISFKAEGDTMVLDVDTPNKKLTATIPKMTADELKQITKVSAYDNMLKFTYLEGTGTNIHEVEKVYNFDLYVLKSEFDTVIKNLTDKVNNVGEVHQLSDKACYYNCVNHGKIGYCIIYNLGETGDMLINFDVDLEGCLNASLNAGREWTVEAIPTDLTTGEEFNDTRDWQPCTFEMVYLDGTRKLLEGTCNVTHCKLTVPSDAVRDEIEHCWLKAILKFDKK